MLFCLRRLRHLVPLPLTQGCQHLQIKMRGIPEGEMTEGHDAGESTGGGGNCKARVTLGGSLYNLCYLLLQAVL